MGEQIAARIECRGKDKGILVEELETNLLSLVLFITLNICSTCFEH